MDKNNAEEPVKNTGKTSWEDTLGAAIRSAISKSPKRIYPANDIFSKEIRDMHGDIDLDRAIFSKVFFPGPSKIAAEKAARRKFRWDTNENLDLSQIDHVASILLERLTDYISRNPDHPCRKIYVEQVPEMLAALTTVERETINIKTMQLIYGRSMRKKKAEWIKTTVATKETVNNEVVEVEETVVPTPVSPNEPGSMLESGAELIPVLTSEQTPIATLEATFEVASEPEVPIINTTVPSENIPEPKREDPSAFQNYE